MISSFLSILIFCFAIVPAAHAGNFFVNTVADTNDANAGNGICADSLIVGQRTGKSDG